MGEKEKLDLEEIQHHEEQESRAETRVRAVSGAENSTGSHGSGTQSAAAFSAGTAAFFGREAFGSRQTAPAIRQSVPLGAAQGGDLDEIMEDSAENTTLNAAQRTPRDKLGDQKSVLQGIRKYIGVKNSDKFNRVTAAMDRLVSSLNGNLEADMMANLRKMEEIEQGYQSLIAACTVYLDRKAFTTSGQQRQAAVQTIMDTAQQDLLNLLDARTDMVAMTPEECTATGWNEILGKARSIHLSVENYNAIGKAEGGQVSDVRMLTGANTKLRTGGAFGAMGFFKAEDSLDVEAGKGKERSPQYFIALKETLKKYPKLSKRDRELLRTFVDLKGKYYRRGFEEITNKLSGQGKKAYGELVKYAEANSTQIDEVLHPMGLLDEGGSINMSRRNVATSRVASLLGIGNLVAKSQTAEVYDEATGTTIRGNLMDAAQGEEYGKAMKKLGTAHKKGDYSQMKGSFQRDLINLQVLDVLCGQSDRHGRNIFYQFDEEGKLSGLQGIDNDASFGTNLDVVYMEENARHDRRAYDPESGELTLPYMDRALAERILAIEPDMLRFALKDLLRESEIEAAVRRLEMMKTAVARAKEAQERGGQKRLLEDGEWNEDTARAMAERSRRLDGESTSGEFAKQLNSEQDAYTRELLLEGWRKAGAADPEAALAEMNTRLAEKKTTPQDEAIMSEASILAGRRRHKLVMGSSKANDTYFGKMFK